MGTPIAQELAQTDIHLRAESYGIPAQAVDGMSVLDVETAARAAAEEVRSGGGPRFLELRTSRYRAHSMADPDLYRTKDEIEHWKERDPIALFETLLREASLLTDADLSAVESDIAAELDEAVAVAEAGPLEPLEDLLEKALLPPTQEPESNLIPVGLWVVGGVEIIAVADLDISCFPASIQGRPCGSSSTRGSWPARR